MINKELRVPKDSINTLLHLHILYLFLFTSTSGIDENVFWMLGTTMDSLRLSETQNPFD